MTKTDDVLLALSRTINGCIQNLRAFQYKGKTCRLVGNFASSQYMKCVVCGNYPLLAVSVIRSEDGDRLKACNNCIDQMTNRAISGRLKTYGKKRENILENRKHIDGFSSILANMIGVSCPFRCQVKTLKNCSIGRNNIDTNSCSFANRKLGL